MGKGHFTTPLTVRPAIGQGFAVPTKTASRKGILRYAQPFFPRHLLNLWVSKMEVFMKECFGGHLGERSWGKYARVDLSCQTRPTLLLSDSPVRL